MFIRTCLAMVLLLIILSFTSGQASQGDRYYSVTFVGPWSQQDRQAAEAGIEAVASKLATIHIETPEAAFKRAFGEITFMVSPSITGNYWAYVKETLVIFKPGKVTPRLVGHELGHVFEKVLWIRAGNCYEDSNPIMILIKDGIWANDSTFITGRFYGKYLRNGGKLAPENGYYSDTYRDEGQYHPYWMGDSGKYAHEDWADMFMNWAFGTFIDNRAGDTLDQWVTRNMYEWISVVHPKDWVMRDMTSPITISRGKLLIC
jgi:hypothetical protein